MAIYPYVLIFSVSTVPLKRRVEAAVLKLSKNKSNNKITAFKAI